VVLSDNRGYEYILEEEKAIKRLGGTRPAVRRLALYLRLPPFVSRDKEKALKVLWQCGPLDRNDELCLVPGLIVSMRDPNFRVRARAARWFERWPDHAGSAVPALEAASRDADVNVRRAATEALRRIRGEK